MAPVTEVIRPVTRAAATRTIFLFNLGLLTLVYDGREKAWAVWRQYEPKMNATLPSATVAEMHQ